MLTSDRVQIVFLHLSLSPNIFLSCPSNVETNDYLLLQCPVVKKLWVNLLLLVNLSWVFPKSVASLISKWSAPHLDPKASQLWKLFVHALLWMVGEKGIDGSLITRVEMYNLYGFFSFYVCCRAKSSSVFAMYSVDSFMINLGAILLPRKIVP